MERRRRRSLVPQQAVTLFLESLREKQALGAVALSTQEGLLIAGSGAADLEALAAFGAASKAKRFDWQGQQAHVTPTTLDGIPLVLTAVGGEVKGADAAIDRILGW